MRTLAACGLGLVCFLTSPLFLASPLFLPSPLLADQDAEIRLTLKDHRFVPAEVRVKQNTRVRLIITNADATVEEFESPALNREKLIPPGKTITILLRPLKPGVYDFFGEFNPETATGRLIVE